MSGKVLTCYYQVFNIVVGCIVWLLIDFQPCRLEIRPANLATDDWSMAKHNPKPLPLNLYNEVLSNT